MKLHLPKALFTAVLAAFAVSQTTWAETTHEVWTNFGCTVDTVNSANTALNMPAGDAWNNIVKPKNNGHATGIYTLKDTTGAEVASLNLLVNANCWGPGSHSANVLEQMQSSYLDVNGAGQPWLMGLVIDDISASDVSLTLYFSGDNNKYAPVIVNGTSYIGGTNTEGSDKWGVRQYSTTMDENNTIILTNVGSAISMSSTHVEGGRATISGMSFSYKTEDLYTATLGSGDNAAAGLSYTYGENTVAWADINTADAYISVAGAEDGTSVYTLAAGADLKGLQVSSKTVTLTSAGAITVDKLWVTTGSILNLNATLAQNASGVEIGGGGQVNMNTSQTLGGLTLSGAVNLAENVTITLSGEENYVTGTATITGAGKLTMGDEDKLNVQASKLENVLSRVEGGTLYVTGSGEAVLTGTANHNGNGESINTNPSVTSYAYDGTISMAADTKLVLGNAATGQYTHVGWAVSLENATIDINGGGIRYNGHYSTIGTLNVNAADELHFYDVYNKNYASGLTIKDLNLKADLKISTNWKGNGTIQALRGTGDLEILSGGDGIVLSIESIAGSGSITNGGNLTLGKGEDSVLNLGGNVSNTGTLSIKGQLAGVSTISGGTINVEGTASVTGEITFDTAITVAGTITNSGALTLNGNVSIANLGELDSTGEYTDNEGKDGYMLSAKYIVVSTKGTGTATLGSEALKLNDTYTLVKDGENIVFNVTADEPTGDYYVNTTVDYTAGSTIAADTTTGITMNGGTLNLNTALAKDISISTAKSGSVINVADGVTLANSSVAAGSTKSTITGGSTAVYDMGSGWSVDNMVKNGLGAYAVNVTFGEAWNGVTVLTNVNIGNSNLDSFTREGGTLKLVGYSGWMSFDSNNNANVNSNLVLENYSNTVEEVTTTKSAFVFDDNSQDKKYNFNGDISGSGDFQIASRAGSSTTITFAGDTAEWKGGIVVTNAYNSTDNGKDNTNTVDVNLTAGGDIFSADGNKGFVMDRASTNDGDNIINLNIGNADADSTMNGAISMGDNAGDRAQLNLTVKGDTTFKKEVEVTSLTVDANKTATLEAATTTDALTTNGTVELTGAGSLTYGGTTTVAAPYTGYNTEAAAATITSDAITGGSVTFNNTEDVTESRVISDAAIFKYGTGTANVKVGDANAAVWVEEGNLAMTADNGSTSLAEMTIAAGSQVSTTGDLTVTDALTIIGDAATPALSVTGALTLAGAEINLTNLTLQEGVTSYTLGTVTGGIDTTGVSLKFGANQLADAGFEGYTATVGASDTDATALVLTLTANQPAEQPLDKLTITGGTFDATSGVLTFTTEEAVTDNLASTIEVTMSDEVWNGILEEYTTLPDTVLVSFQGKDSEQLFDFNGADDTGTVPTITINGEGITGTPEVGGNGTIVGNYVTAYIPEPTTTTLSLLALAGLAVRRRRASR